MKMKTKERGELRKDNQKHFERKQNPFLQSETLLHYRNRYIKLHDRNSTFTRRRVNNVHVKNHELNKIKLRNLRKENIDHYLNS